MDAVTTFTSSSLFAMIALVAISWFVAWLFIHFQRLESACTFCSRPTVQHAFSIGSGDPGDPDSSELLPLPVCPTCSVRLEAAGKAGGGIEGLGQRWYIGRRMAQPFRPDDDARPLA